MACYHYSCAARSSERTAVRVTLSVSSDESPVLLGRYMKQYVYIYNIYIYIYIYIYNILYIYILRRIKPYT